MPLAIDASTACRSAFRALSRTPNGKPLARFDGLASIAKS